MNQNQVAVAEYFSERGFTLIPLNGKKPIQENWPNTPHTPKEKIRTKFENHNSNLGVLVNGRLMVIDNDPRNHKDGVDSLMLLISDIGYDIRSYGMHVLTGGGGDHIYTWLPSDAPKIKKDVDRYPGIEFKNSGQVVMPSGIHPETQLPYTFADLESGRNLDNMSEISGTLLDIIRRPDSFIEEREDIEEVTDENPLVVSRYSEFLENYTAAVEGENGDLTTFQAACSGKDMGLSREKTFALMVEIYNPRCAPVWEHEELWRKVLNAYEYSQGALGQTLPQNDFDEVKEVYIDITGEEVDISKVHGFESWQHDKDMNLKRNLNNVLGFLTQESYRFKGTLVFNEFSDKVLAVAKLPWDLKSPGKKGREWSDSDTYNFMAHLSTKYKFDIGKDNVDIAVNVVAQYKKVHPVRDYLNELHWDGKHRLEHWLVECAGAVDNKYVRATSKMCIMQMVERVFKPGCKCDYMVVIEGCQGIGKSGIVKILGGEWTSEEALNLNKLADTAEMLRGMWVSEQAELVSLRKADFNQLKAFITRQTDRYRPAYGRRTIDLKRQWTLIGTVNPGAINDYINDATGGRRFWPVLISMVDFRKLELMRDQLFAEATHRMKQGEASHVTDGAVLAIAAEEQRKRQSVDGWQDSVTGYCIGENKEHVTILEVFLMCIKGSEKDLGKLQQNRIAECLRTCGFINKTIRIEGVHKPVKRWVNGNFIKPLRRPHGPR